MELNFYSLSVLYLVYSFLGWVGETVVATITGRRFANRGVASGPFCFIYGFTAVLLAISFADRPGPLLLFLVVVPFWTNSLIRTYALKVLLGTRGLINGWLLDLGLIERPLQMLKVSPSMYGILMSVITTSGWISSAISNASTPFLAYPAIRNPIASQSSFFIMTEYTSSSSSTNNTEYKFIVFYSPFQYEKIIFSHFLPLVSIFCIHIMP